MLKEEVALLEQELALLEAEPVGFYVYFMLPITIYHYEYKF